MSVNFGFSLPAYATLAGAGGRITPVVDGFLLQEDGFYVLQEDGSKILLTRYPFILQQDGSLLLQEDSSAIYA